VAQSLPGRSGKQCRERWLNHLTPILKSEHWSPIEDEILIAHQRTLGNVWSQISLFLTGRSPNSVKNRWAVLSSRDARKARPPPEPRQPPIPAGCADLLRRHRGDTAKIDNFEVFGLGTGSIVEEEDE
jgi:hypothetical protein